MEKSSSFFTAPAEDEGVAPFETHDRTAFPGLGDEQVVDFFLTQRMMTGGLSDVNAFGLWPGEVQQPFVGQMVGDDRISPFQQFLSPEGEQAPVSGTGADEIDGSCHNVSPFMVVRSERSRASPPPASMSLPSS